MKAVLTMRQRAFRRTHDLEELANLLADAKIALPVDIADLRKLGPYAVELRYDDRPEPLITLEMKPIEWPRPHCAGQSGLSIRRLFERNVRVARDRSRRFGYGLQRRDLVKWMIEHCPF